MSGGAGGAARALPSEAEIGRWLESLPLGGEARVYARMHLPRYERSLRLVARLLDGARAPLPPGEEPIVCDVAPHLLSEVFARWLRVRVNSVGVRFPVPGCAPREHEHMDYDLNRAHKPEGWQGFVRHDVVYLGEVIEHLHASPRQVLGCASRWVKDGGWLVVQTPNAASLSRRLTLLLGRNPYEMIRDGDDPGHFREYTADELERLAAGWQLRLEEVHYENYFAIRPNPLRRASYGLATRLPRTFRDGMTLVFRKPHGVPDPGAPSRMLRGFLEYAEVEGHVLTVAGWVADLSAPGSLPPLEILHGDDLLLKLSPTFDRPDVATALGGDPRHLRCGFHGTCPVPAALAASAVQVRARDSYGDVLSLPRLPTRG